MSRILPPRAADFPVDDAAVLSAAVPSDLGAVIDAAVRGEGAAWEALFDRFHGVVYRYAMARSGDPGAAEEVAQEVFVAAVNAVTGLRERREPAVEAWFLRIARYKLADRVRRGIRDSRPRPEPDTGLADPAELVALRSEANEVRRAMDALTEEQREIVIRRFVLDQSLEQVAAATGRRVGAVKALQHRALGALGRRLRREAAA